MPNNAYSQFVKDRKTEIESDMGSITASVKSMLDGYRPQSPPSLTTPERTNALNEINDMVFQTYSSLGDPSLNDSEKRQYRYIADTLIAQAYGTDVQHVIANPKKYRNLVFGDSNIDDKSFVNAFWDSWKSYGVQSDISRLQSKWLSTDDSDRRAEIDAQIQEKKKELVLLGDYNEDRNIAADLLVSSAPLMRQIATTAAFTFAGMGIGGFLAGSGGAIGSLVDAASKVNVLKNVISGGSLVQKGMSVGRIAGMTLDGMFNTFQMEYGMSIDEFRSLEDEAGNTIDEDTIRKASLLRAGINTFLEFATPDIVGGSFLHGNKASGLINDLSLKTARQYIGQGAREAVKGGINESLEEALQGMASILVTDYAKDISNTYKGTRFEVDAMDTISDAISEGFSSFIESIGPMMLVGGVSSVSKGTFRAIDSRKAKEFVGKNFEHKDGTIDVDMDSIPNSPYSNVSEECLNTHTYKVDNRSEEQKESQSTTAESTDDVSPDFASAGPENIYSEALDSVEETDGPSTVELSESELGEAIDESDVDSDDGLEYSYDDLMQNEGGIARETPVEYREKDTSKPSFIDPDGDERQFKGSIPTLKMKEVGGDSLTFATREDAELGLILEKMKSPGARVEIVHGTADRSFDPVEYVEIVDVNESSHIITARSRGEADAIYENLLIDDVIFNPDRRKDRRDDGSYDVTITRNGVNEQWTIRHYGSDAAARPTSSNEAPGENPTMGASSADLGIAERYIRDTIGDASSEYSIDDAVAPAADALLLYSRAIGIPISDIVRDRRISFEVVTDSNYVSFKKRHGEARGYTSTGDRNHIVINLTRNADATTALHEIGHAVRLSLDGERLRSFTDYYGSGGGAWIEDVRQEGDAWRLGDRTFNSRNGALNAARRNEERFANDLSRYIATGRAPSPVVEPVFQRIRKFIAALLSRFAGDMDPDLRRRFDALFTYGQDVSESVDITREDADIPLMQSIDNDNDPENRTQMDMQSGKTAASPNERWYAPTNVGKQLSYDEIMRLYEGGYYVPSSTILNYMYGNEIDAKQRKGLQRVLNDIAFIQRYDMIADAKKASGRSGFRESMKRKYHDLGVRNTNKNMARIDLAWNWSRNPTPEQMRRQFIDTFANKDGILTLKNRMMYYKSVYVNERGTRVIATRRLNSQHINSMLEGITRDSDQAAFDMVASDMRRNTKVWQRAFNTVYKSQGVLADGGDRAIQAEYMDFVVSFKSDYWWDWNTTTGRAGLGYGIVLDDEIIPEDMQELAAKVESARTSRQDVPDLTEQEYRDADMYDRSVTEKQMQSDADERVRIEREKHDAVISELKTLYSEANAELKKSTRTVKRRQKTIEELRAKLDSYRKNAKKELDDAISEMESRYSDSMKRRIAEMKAGFDESYRGMVERDKAIREQDKADMEKEYRQTISDIEKLYKSKLEVLRRNRDARVKRLRDFYNEKALKQKIEQRFSDLLGRFDTRKFDVEYVPMFQLISAIRSATLSIAQIMDPDRPRQPDSNGQYTVFNEDGSQTVISSTDGVVTQESMEKLWDELYGLVTTGAVTIRQAQDLYERMNSTEEVHLKYHYKKVHNVDGTISREPVMMPKSAYVTWDPELRLTLLKLLQKTLSDARASYNVKKERKRVYRNDLKARMASSVASDYRAAYERALRKVVDDKYAEYVNANRMLTDEGISIMSYEEFEKEIENDNTFRADVEGELTRSISGYFEKTYKGNGRKGLRGLLDQLDRIIIKPQNLATILDGLVAPASGIDRSGPFYEFFVRRAWENKNNGDRHVQERLSALKDNGERILGYRLDEIMTRKHLGRPVELHYAEGVNAGKAIPGIVAMDALSVYIYSKNGIDSDTATIMQSVNGANISRDDIMRITDGEILTDSERRFADWMVEELDSNFSRVAEVMQDTENRIMLRLKNYFPLKPDSIDGPELTMSGGGSQLRSIWDGFTQQRSGAIYKPYMNAYSLFIDAVKAQEHYIANNGWAMDARSILEDTASSGVGNLISAYGGNQYRNALRSYYNRIAAGDPPVEDYLKSANRFVGNLNAARIALSIPSMLRQFISLSTAKLALGSDAKGIGKSFVKVAGSYGDTMEFIYSRDATMRQRTFDPSLAQFIDSPEFASLDYRRQRAARLMLKASQLFDNVVAGTVWLSRYNTAIDSGMSEADAVFEASQAVQTTQSTTDRLSLSEIQSNRHPLVRSFLAFTNDLFQVWGQLYHQLPLNIRAAIDAKRNDEDYMGYVGSIVMKALIPFAGAALSSLIGADWLPEDDEDEGVFSIEDFAGGVAEELTAQLVPVAGLLWQDAVSGFSNDNAFTGYIKDFMDFANPTRKGDDGNLEFKGWKTMLDDMSDLSIDAMEIFGLPANMARRGGRALFDADGDSIEFEINFGHLYNSALGNFMDGRNMTLFGGEE